MLPYLLISLLQYLHESRVGREPGGNIVVALGCLMRPVRGERAAGRGAVGWKGSPCAGFCRRSRRVAGLAPFAGIRADDHVERSVRVRPQEPVDPGAEADMGGITGPWGLV